MQRDTTSEELLPCPFCGSEAVIRTGDECAVVQCRDVKMHRLFVDGDNTAADIAVEHWNRRAVNAYPALVEALEEARVEIGEAADKMRVLGLNHPAGNSFLEEDRALMLKLADRFDAADRRARAALALSARGDGS